MELAAPNVNDSRWVGEREVGCGGSHHLRAPPLSVIYGLSRCQRSPQNCGPPRLSTVPYLVPPGQTLETNPVIL